MHQFIPRGKLGKKARRELDQSRRRFWQETNPVTRTIESKKHYNRKKPSYRFGDDGTRVFSYCFSVHSYCLAFSNVYSAGCSGCGIL